MGPTRPVLVVPCAAFLGASAFQAWHGVRWLQRARDTPLEVQGSIRFCTVADASFVSAGVLAVVTARLGHGVYLGRRRPRPSVRLHPAAGRGGRSRAWPCSGGGGRGETRRGALGCGGGRTLHPG